MAKFKGRFFSVIAFSVFSLFILGCNPEKEDTSSNLTETLKLNSGAVLKSEEGNYNLYDYENNKYVKSESDMLVLVYDKASGNYVYSDKDTAVAVYNKKEFKLEDKQYLKLKISQGGDYFSYFVDNEGMKLKVFNLKEEKQIDINSNVSISGTFYDWYNEKSLVYYGVSNDGVNGIFTYNVEENKEELLYKLKEGYLAYLRGSTDDVIFLQLNFDNERELVMLDKDTKKVKILSDDIEEIKDVLISEGSVYFLGRIKDNVDSLYKIDDTSIKRVVYDFPVKIYTDKGLETDENNNILFIGSNNVNSNEQQIYKYSNDGSISSISDVGIDYAFIDYIN